MGMKFLLITTLFFVSSIVLKAQQAEKKSDDKKGVASFYHPKFEGRKTATGEIFKNGNFTAACNKLTLGTFVKVTNLANGIAVYVRINDRMAAANKRLIDLASIAAEKLGFIDDGITKVKIETVPIEEGRNGILAQREIARADAAKL
jgi:rare lipoprotein A